MTARILLTALVLCAAIVWIATPAHSECREINGRLIGCDDPVAERWPTRSDEPQARAPLPQPAGDVPAPAPNPLTAAERLQADLRRKAALAEIEAGGPGLASMIGQMLMVGFQGDDVGDPGVQRVLRHIEAGRLGGVILFRQNVKSADAVKRMTRAFRDASPGLPVLVAVDQEGGRVERLTRAVGFPETPSAARVADGGLAEARTLYARMAEGLARWGFNVNLAPVVDLAARPDNPIITRIGRAYSPDPATVTALATAFVDAHDRAGILTSLKHFPGHGSSSGDTHHGFVDVTGSWTRAELVPFRDMIARGKADMVMVAHVHHAEFSPPGSRAPASLSPRVIEGLLRGDLGFDGVVISDDMEMGAIRKLGSPLDVAARAILAGNDILVYAGGAAPGQDLVAVLQDRLKEAALRDPKVAERIRQSYQRIVRMKQGLR